MSEIERCAFVHTRKSGGKIGKRCDRPEAEHCPGPFSCDEHHPPPGKVHHPFHRPAAPAAWDGLGPECCHSRIPGEHRKGCKNEPEGPTGAAGAKCPECEAWLDEDDVRDVFSSVQHNDDGEMRDAVEDEFFRMRAEIERLKEKLAQEEHATNVVNRCRMESDAEIAALKEQLAAERAETRKSVAALIEMLDPIDTLFMDHMEDREWISRARVHLDSWARHLAARR